MTGDKQITVTKAQQTIEWKIKDFFDKPKDVSINSFNFSFANDEWFVGVSPSGDQENDSIGWVSLYLHKDISRTKPRVKYTLGIKCLDGSDFDSFSDEWTFNNCMSGWGIAKLRRWSELLRMRDVVAPEGTLTVFCSMTLETALVSNKPMALTPDYLEGNKDKDASGTLGEYPENEFQKQDPPPNSPSEKDETLNNHFKEMYMSGLHADIKIKIKDREFNVHKCVLAARSTVFAAMFKHNMNEKNTGVVYISDPNIDPDVFEIFLVYLYSGIMDHVSPISAIRLYYIGDKYDLMEMKKACAMCLDGNLLMESVCDVIHFAIVHDESELLNSATDFFIENSSSLLATKKWKDFLLEYPLDANELFVKMANKGAAINSKCLDSTNIVLF